VGKYQTYLDGEKWKEKRRSTLARVKSKSKRAVFQCEKCKEFFHADAIEVHHKTYRDIGSEKPNQLDVICKWCHSELHGKHDHAFLLTDTKETYRIMFEADRKILSDGEMNHKRNDVLNALKEIE